MWEVVILDSITAVNFTHTNAEHLGLCILGGRKCEMSCILETGTNLIPGWASLQSQRSHNNATAIPSPGFQNKCVYHSSASHGGGEVPKTAMTTAATAHKHSDRKTANTKADRKKHYKKNNRPINWSEHSQKAISFRLLTPLCHETKTTRQKQTELEWLTLSNRSLLFLLCSVFYDT